VSAGVTSEQQPKHESVRDEQQRDEHSRNEVGGALHTRREAKANTIALDERVDEVNGAHDVAFPRDSEAGHAGNKSSAISESVAVIKSPYAAGAANAAGMFGETTPGTRNASPTKRKV